MKKNIISISWIILWVIIIYSIIYVGECQAQEKKSYRKAMAEATEQTNKELEKELEELRKILEVDLLKLMPRYYYYKNKYPFLSDKKIEICLEMEKDLKELRKLQRLGYINIKRDKKKRMIWNYVMIPTACFFIIYGAVSLAK